MKRSIFLLLDHHPETGETLADIHGFVLEHARRADALGFDALWLAEHHFLRIGTVPNPAVMLAAIAMETERLRLGPAVSVLPYRNPVLVAEDYALVDQLSRGRLNMGVGCGSQRAEFAGLGVEFESRNNDFHRNLDALRELWSGDKLNVVPCQPRPPIYVATTNADTARAVGRRGDSVVTLLRPGTPGFDALAALLAAHRQGLEEGGHARASAEVVVALLAHAALTDAAARRAAVPAIARFPGAPSMDDAEANRLYLSMQQAATACFGAPEQARDIVARLEREGVAHIAFITRFGNLDPAAAHRSLQLVAPTA